MRDVIIVFDVCVRMYRNIVFVLMCYRFSRSFRRFYDKRCTIERGKSYSPRRYSATTANQQMKTKEKEKEKTNGTISLSF